MPSVGCSYAIALLFWVKYEDEYRRQKTVHMAYCLIMYSLRSFLFVALKNELAGDKYSRTDNGGSSFIAMDFVFLCHSHRTRVRGTFYLCSSCHRHRLSYFYVHVKCSFCVDDLSKQFTIVCILIRKFYMFGNVSNRGKSSLDVTCFLIVCLNIYC
jgi:hypothetical protein